MNRIVTFLTTLIFICPIIRANEEYNISLEKGDTTKVVTELPYGNISFSLAEYGNSHKVSVSIENTTPSQAILIFRNPLEEKILKKIKPKIKFEKTYPGSKGYRTVMGCKELSQTLVSVVPQEKSDLCEFDVSSNSVTRLWVPIYLAKYDPKKLVRKGVYNINYKILSEDVLYFNIELKGWSENDPQYISAKSAVEEYVRSVNAVAFCKNPRHRPTLAEQQRPFKEKKDSLINVIKSTLQNNSEWFSTDKPHIKYTELLTQLNNVNLNEHTYDCGEHKPVRKQHSCSYCSLNAQQIYHQLDDIYQQLRAGKLTKEVAVKRAKSLNACYHNSTKRKKSAVYTDKISKFYSRIINY